MSILNEFSDFPQATATIKVLSTTNTNGEISKTWTTVATGPVWLYTTTSSQLDQQGKLQILEVNNIIYNPEEIVNAPGQAYDLYSKGLKVTINDIDYFIEGKNDQLRFDEIVVLSARKET